MIELITKIYIGANLFFAGYYLADTYKWQDTKIEKIICLLWCFGTMLLGCVYILLSFLWVLLSESFKKVDGYFQVSFWFSYYLTKKWNKLEKHQLERINRITINVRNKNTIKDKIYRYCTSLINKRNNYVHVEPSEPQF